MTTDRPLPAMSVILSCTGKFDKIAPTLRYLQKQTAAKELEIIVVAPETGFILPNELETAFHSVRLVKLNRLEPLGTANAAGVHHATAPVVVFSEDHVFPEPEWAEALIARHQENWAAVGPTLRNANATSAVSRADFLLGYGPWQEGTSSGEMSILPGHNCSYKRAVLLRQGEKLADFLHAESILHTELVKNGERLFLENRAVVSHLNFARLGTLLFVQFHQGRQYAGRRIWNWSLGRRLVFLGGAPLIPFVRLKRLLAGPRPRLTVRFLGVLLSALLADGLGQGLGYLAGVGRSTDVLRSYEYERRRFVSRSDRSDVAVQHRSEIEQE